ncbi:EcsC family protein [Chitinophagaceae bacterium LB-8]|uniref:EcsC family protein n=1 Tax=Paraflavisolibacter caeni TaxID=2982496 RepID=A0A9X3BGF9_9BACT|nr:EcsC family protein [Paraflavisolibacter caeni]MCU7547703.1 EcsC family protein [Paraflavisolibacter caeni]
MTYYEQMAGRELASWKYKMTRRPSIFNKISSRVQTKLNSYIPEKIHKTITTVIKQMVRGVLFGAKYTSKQQLHNVSLQLAEAEVQKSIYKYKHAAAVEGGITGAGGLLLGLADFPIFLSIKLSMLFDIASLYGFSVKDYKERVYILHIFQLAFSNQEHRRDVFEQMKDWDLKKEQLPDDIHLFNWRKFQQEYRDYIDLAKLGQLIPGIGAVIGYVANYRMVDHLGKMAMNAYRMRLLENPHVPVPGPV